MTNQAVPRCFQVPIPSPEAWVAGGEGYPGGGSARETRRTTVKDEPRCNLVSQNGIKGPNLRRGTPESDRLRHDRIPRKVPPINNGKGANPERGNERDEMFGSRSIPEKCTATWIFRFADRNLHKSTSIVAGRREGLAESSTGGPRGGIKDLPKTPTEALMERCLWVPGLHSVDGPVRMEELALLDIW